TEVIQEERVTAVCKGGTATSTTFTVTVNPTPTVASVPSQGPYCNGAPGAVITFTSPESGATFAWTSSVNVGFGTSGSGNIAAFKIGRASCRDIVTTRGVAGAL